MMLVDSNIIIYAAKPEHSFLLQLMEEQAPAASAISYLEVLGCHKLTTEEKEHFERFFAEAGVVQITNRVIHRAAGLRQLRKMSVADAIIAATALERDFTLVTRNTADFDWIPDLRLLNPFDGLQQWPREERGLT